MHNSRGIWTSPFENWYEGEEPRSPPFSSLVGDILQGGKSMSMEITGIVGQNSAAPRTRGNNSAAQHAVAKPRTAVKRPRPEDLIPKKSDIKIAQVAEEMQMVADAMNKRLKFTVNHELGQVIVKVVDKQTDKVIKELPPEELQRMHIRIREAIGLLIDEAI